MAFIRPYAPSDFDATALICRETLAPSLRGSDDAWRISPYLWTHPYTHLSPSTCFVLDDGRGRAVGYCIGCRDVRALAASYPSYVADVVDGMGEVGREEASSSGAPEQRWVPAAGDGEGGGGTVVVNGAWLARMARDPGMLLIEGNEDVLDDYPATMHVDILEGWRSGGWGRRLVERFLGCIDNDNTAGGGVCIGVSASNSSVVGFYERLGFRVLDNRGTIRMVRGGPQQQQQGSTGGGGR